MGQTQRETGKEASSLIKQCPGVLEHKHRRGTESDWQDEHMSTVTQNQILQQAFGWSPHPGLGRITGFGVIGPGFEF